MSENRNMEDFDLMVRSILDEGQEEVPAHVWEGVAEGLEKHARRKTVVLWWRRSAIGVAAAAAVALGVLMNHTETGDIVPHSEDLIAVVTPEITEDETYEEAPVTEIPKNLTAYVRKTASPAETAIEKTELQDNTVIKENPATVQKPVVSKTEPDTKAETAPEAPEYFPEDWGEEKERKDAGISLVFSGLASTNSAQSQNRLGPMKAPTASSAPKKTGITETSTKSSYGIPLSFGAGVKIDFTPEWSLGIGVNYSYLARQFYGKYTLVNEDGTIANTTSSDIRNTQHFIGIPVNAFYNLVDNRNLKFYAYAGGTIEKCLSDNYNVLSTSIRHKERPEGLQLSANAGIGVEFLLGKHLGLYLDPSIRYYFNNGQPKSIRTVQPLMFGFEAGLRFSL